MSIKIYAEGGGASSALKTKCREGFGKFFQKAGLTGRMPRVVACGSRNNAFDSFKRALTSAGPDELPLLLVDSEGPVADPTAPWKHLQGRDGWQKPGGADEYQTHLMVQCMETWFLADRECLAKFFGQGFKSKALPGNQAVETIAKSVVFRALESATKDCKPKGAYRKAKHSFEVLVVTRDAIEHDAGIDKPE